MLSLIFKGKMTDFPNEATDAGFSAEVLVVEVSITPIKDGGVPAFLGSS